jgi:hypothetical protein
MYIFFLSDVKNGSKQTLPLRVRTFTQYSFSDLFGSLALPRPGKLVPFRLSFVFIVAPVRVSDLMKISRTF